MKTLLAVLKADGEVRVMKNGRGAVLFRYSDGTLGAMLRPSGVTHEAEPATLRGLRKLFAWLDAQPGGIL